MKSVEYDMNIENDASTFDIDEQVNKNEKLPTLLLVEDNKELRVHLKNDLKDKYIIKEAVNGEDGIKMVKKHFPDIIVSDVMMPGKDGYEVCIRYS